VGCLLWGLILFGPSQTVIHQGSLLLPVLAIAGAVAGLRAIAPHIAFAVVLLSISVVLLLYVSVLNPAPGTSFPAPGTSYSPAAATAIAVSLFGFVAVALRSRPVDQEPQSAPATL